MPKFWVIDSDNDDSWEWADEVEAKSPRDAIEALHREGLEDRAQADGAASAVFFVADNPRGVGAKAYRWSLEIVWDYSFDEDRTQPPAPLEEDPE